MLHETQTPQELLASHPLATSLTSEDYEFLIDILSQYHPTYQQIRILIEQAIDLRLWRQNSISIVWNESSGEKFQGKLRFKAIMQDMMHAVSVLRKEPTDYADFTEKPHLSQKIKHVESLGDIRLLGRCPCPVSGEKTRCCNLQTLDVVQQCAFACSYCSIQSFYHKDEIVFASNLSERLEQLELPQETWHIGTGQSSDSLMWGNEHGVLDALVRFAEKHPQVIIELKTKSARTDWIQQINIPRNMIATWSLNAPTIITKEEHKSAALENRIQAARRAADAGILVGFHLHPMVYFKGWEHEYHRVISSIVDNFSPEEVVMISLGTLTFTKEVLRQLRQSNQPSRILQMELSESAGKYSYPAAIKQQMFTFAYSCFPESWKSAQAPFFYLCMELPELWEPVFGRSYPDNRSFEMDMRIHYEKRVGIHS